MYYYSVASSIPSITDKQCSGLATNIVFAVLCWSMTGKDTCAHLMHKEVRSLDWPMRSARYMNCSQHDTAKKICGFI